MSSLEDIKLFVRERALLSHSELERQLMGSFHLNRKQAKALLHALHQESNAEDPTSESSLALLYALGTIETQQPPSVVSGVATMIDATIEKLERERHPEPIRSDQPKLT